MTPEQIRERYRGLTPSELEHELENLEARLRLLHKDGSGSARSLSEAEQRDFDETLLARDHVQETISRHATLRRGAGRAVSAYHGLSRGGADVDGDPLRMRGEQARSQALRVLERGGKRLSADQADRVATLIKDVDQEGADEESYIARRILLTETDTYRSAWRRVMTEARPILTADEADALRTFETFDRMQSRAMAESPTSAGGFGIPVFIDPSIILTAQGSGDPFLEIAKVVDVNTNVWKGVTSAGVSWSFQAEGSTVADGSPVLAQPVVTVFMARGFIPYSIEVGMDYPQFAEEMAALLASGYVELLADKFARGSGSGEPQGVITALDADTNDEVLLTTAGAFGEVDLYALWKALPQRFRRQASFMMSVGVNNAIRRFGTNVGFHAFTESLPGGWVDRLMNRQVYESAYFPDIVNTTGHFNQVVVGDFSNYVIARRGGMNTELVPTLFDITNNRPTGQRGWFAYARVGGGVVNDTAFRLLNQT